jgi:transposase-like protein
MVSREGVRRMLQQALDDEVRSCLGRDRSAPGGAGTGYRNGHGRPREIGMGRDA